MRIGLLVLVGAVVVALAVPTAAMTVGGGDEVGDVVELSPHPGPNGQYASMAGGKIRVDFADINDDAKTTADDVFTVTASSNETVFVTVEAEADAIRAYGGSGSAVGPGNPVVLRPGERLDVGFRIDTRESVPTTSTVTVTAKTLGDVGMGAGPGMEPEEREEPEERSVEVVFPDSPPGADDVRFEWLDGLPEDGPAAPPRAVIEPDPFSPAGSGLTVSRGRLVTGVGEPVTLTGRRSIVSNADAIARNLQVAAVVEIAPPASLRDRAAKVRIRVPREQLGAPAEATVARRTEGGWQLLPTKVLDADEETVLLEAETPGFSVFAVVAGSDVTYEWTLPNGTVVSGGELRTAFEEPGRYDVSLSVTDAEGRTDRTVRRVLANDRPTVEIRGAEDPGPEERTLRANVTNVVGNTTVTWTFPNGTTAEGPNATGTFESGDVVEVTVEDEFGASDTASAVVGAGAAARQAQSPASRFVPTAVPLWLQVLLALSAVSVAVAAARSRAPEAVADLRDDAADAAASILDRLASESPRITAFETPRWNPAEDCVEIPSLSVEAPSGHLRSVEIAVSDSDGNDVVRKTIDAGGEATFSASRLQVPVYGGVELAERDTYRVQVRAVDEFDRVGLRGQAEDLHVGPGAAG